MNEDRASCLSDDRLGSSIFFSSRPLTQSILDTIGVSSAAELAASSCGRMQEALVAGIDQYPAAPDGHCDRYLTSGERISTASSCGFKPQGAKGYGFISRAFYSLAAFQEYSVEDAMGAVRASRGACVFVDNGEGVRITGAAVTGGWLEVYPSPLTKPLLASAPQGRHTIEVLFISQFGDGSSQGTAHIRQDPWTPIGGIICRIAPRRLHHLSPHCR